MNSFSFKRMALIVLLGTAPSLFAETVWLSSLDLKQMTTGWSVAKADHEIAGGPLSIHGERFAHGVGHARDQQIPGGRWTEMPGALPPKWAWTTARAIKAAWNSLSAVTEKFCGDSGVLKGGEAARSVDVNLAGVKTLVLRVTDGGDGESNDHADWANARIEMKDGAPPPVALPPYESFSLKNQKFCGEFSSG